MTKLNPTEEMVKQLVEIEEVLCALDQHAASHGPAPFSLMSETYTKLVKSRDEFLRDWNDEASCGLRDVRRMLYRCDESSHPYHTDDDGPCEVWTPNFAVGYAGATGVIGKAATAKHVCDLHQQLALEAEDRTAFQRAEYLLAKRRGEDV